MKIIDSVRRRDGRHRRRVVTALAAAGVAAAGGIVVTAGVAGAVNSYTVTASPDLLVRSGPGTGYPAMGSVRHGEALDIACQKRSGSFVHGSDVWDRIGAGYVSDYWVSTPVFAAFSPGIPRCGEQPGGVQGPARTRVVVMGDSYASGEGTYNPTNSSAPSVDYYPSTANGDHRCHRSPAAYAPLLGVAGGDFVACSGARVPDILGGSRGEGPQVDVLGPSVKSVVVSAGGDDVGFANVLRECNDIPVVNPHSIDDCKGAVNNALGQVPAMKRALGDLYAQIESRTQGAHLVVVGYPRLFAPDGHSACNWIDDSRQQLLNTAADTLDEAIKSVVNETAGATFVDVRPLFTDHETCGASSGAYISNLQVNFGPYRNCPDDRVASGACSQSFHPNALAYRAEAALLKPTVAQGPSGPASPQPPQQPFQGPAGGGHTYVVHGTCPTGGCILLTRAGPAFSTSPATGRLHEGDAVDIACQARGETVSQSGWGTSNVWNRLTNGSWVSDLYVTTPNVNAFTPGIPQC